MTHDLQVNANRFMGFADIYEKTRPVAPRQAIDIIVRYLNRKPACVVDLGCGTGLSTMVWSGIANEIIGIEPSPDMIGIANKKAEGDDSIRFVPGFSDATGLADKTRIARTQCRLLAQRRAYGEFAEIRRFSIHKGNCFCECRGM